MHWNFKLLFITIFLQGTTGEELSRLIRDLRHWPWWVVGACEYESVVQWCVMSQNPTVAVLSIAERPLDGAIFR